MTPRFTFIVPVLNDAGRLRTCLESIRRNFGLGNLVDIVVVDNGSTDGSPDVARRLGATVLTSTERQVSALRNAGAAVASGDVLAFVDADHEIGSGWLLAARDVMALDNVGAAGAHYRSPVDGTWVQHAYGHLRGRATGQQDVEWLGSGNLVVWRRVFAAVGGFDTSLTACEDVEFCQRVRAAGFRLVSDARLDTIHHGDPETLGAVFRSELWRGRDNLRVSLKGPTTWRTLATALVPVVDVALAVVAFASATAAAAGWLPGIPITLAAVALFVAGAAAKVVRARQRDAAPAAGLVETLVVACVYDVARALALFTRAPHRGTLRTPASSAT